MLNGSFKFSFIGGDSLVGLRRIERGLVLCQSVVWKYFGLLGCRVVCGFLRIATDQGSFGVGLLSSLLLGNLFPKNFNDIPIKIILRD